MSLSHHFIIADKKVDKIGLHNMSTDFFRGNRNNYEYIEISDYLVIYCYDFIRLIKFYNPNKNEYNDGLCYDGITKIENLSIELLILVLNNLSSIFKIGPEEIKLTGGWIVENYQMKNEYGHYEKIKTTKTNICSELDGLSNLLKKAKEKQMCVIHFGI